ncbi:DUF6457 domain-containing protein [Corynebacterium caspium]|uniref:DUF6457 domain-containing protein n=1 Tax=Corynebacterium caspium TaxID=234828 RepID=UPI000380E800|nr:DUF6457 domain-containing protein [Corynebacterium caspium]WKD59831.1 hypothetical protein CCASP_07260 [Corynebacterium caspium DSM 44850]
MSNKNKDIASAHEWLNIVCAELGLDFEELRPLIAPLLDLTRDIAHGPSRPSAPLTTFLLGLAVGRSQTTPGAESISATEEKIKAINAQIKAYMTAEGDL